MSVNFPKSSPIQLKYYSGPLDLLLQLIRKQEMDICQIDFYKITHEYVENLKQIPTPDLEKAGDFIRLASLLLYMKSKTLLPKEEDVEDAQEISTFKNNLICLLETYQKFQKTGELLYNRPLLGRDCWNSPRTLKLKAPKINRIEIDKEKGIFQLIQAYNKTLIEQKVKKNYTIHKAIPSLLDRLKQISEVFTLGARLKFSQLLLINKAKYTKLLSFLSLLELSKAGFISLSQKQAFYNIDIFVKQSMTDKIIEKLADEEQKSIVQQLENETLI